MKKQMKVLITIIIAMMAICICNNVAYAADENISVLLTSDTTTVKQGETIDVVVTLDEFVNTGDGINAFMAKLVYDTNILEIDLSKIVSQNGWDTPTYENGNILTLKGSLVTAKESILKMTFTVKEDATIGDTVIKLENVEVSNSDYDFVGKDGQIALTIATKEVTPNPGETDTEPEGTPNETPNPETTPTPEEQPTTEGVTVTVGGEEDNTIASSKLPNAGLSSIIIISAVVVIAIAIIMYKKYKKYQFIK